MITVKELTKRYARNTAVDHISFEIQKGQIVGVLGPNGAGKTTTMRMLTCFLPPTAGNATVAGFDVLEEPMEVKKRIGYLPETPPLYPEMMTGEYLSFVGSLKGLRGAELKQRIDYVSERCAIADVRNKLLGKLSKGYRQRVVLADTLAHDPQILILDEPTVGLDPLQIRETLALIKELSKEHTILLSTHILSEVEAICRRVIIIHSGRIGLDKRLADLATDDAVIVIEVRGPVEQVSSVLRSTEGVAHVVPQPLGDGLTNFEVRTDYNRDLREAIRRALARRAIVVR